MTLTELEEIKNEIMSMTEVDAEMLLEDRRIDYRVVSRDGRDLVVTCDFKLSRANLTIENNIVVDCHWG